MSTLYIGVDPGKRGGIAVYNPSGTGIAYIGYPFTTEGEMADIITDLAVSASFTGDTLHACLEWVNAMPSGGVKMGATSAFSFGRSFGFYHGLLLGARIGYTQVRPQLWQKSLGLKGRSSSDSAKAYKKYLAEEARRRFPELFAGKRVGWTEAVCDAMFLAFYAHWNVTSRETQF